MKTKHPLHKVILAYGVHLFTTSGLICALIATWFISQGAENNPNWLRWFSVFLMLCVFIDAIDGTMARKCEVKKYTPNIDGALLDNIIDYITFAFLPSYFVLVSHIIQNSALSIISAGAIIISASYQFCNTDAKIDGKDHYFVGFPSYWNIVVLYLLWWQLGEWANFYIILALSALSFVPLKWVYPSRTKRGLKITAPLMLAYSVAICYEIWFKFQQPDAWFMYLSYFVFAYYTLLSLYCNYADKKIAK